MCLSLQGTVILRHVLRLAIVSQRVLDASRDGLLGLDDGVLVLGPPVHVVDVIGPIVGIVYPLPTEGQLVVVALFQFLLLHPFQSGVQPGRGPSIVTAKFYGVSRYITKRNDE